jgi:fatty-acyl-CoA synthase
MLARRAAGAPDALAFARVGGGVVGAQGIVSAASAAAAVGGERLTYGALRLEVLALAGALARLGVGRGERVVLLLPAGLDFVRAFFALQRLAAVPFALSPQLPPATAASGAARVRPRMVLVAGPAAGELAAACAAVELRAIDLATLAEAAAASGDRPALPAASAGPDEPAFLQATSGTSGEPRAAVVLQRNALASLAAARERLEMGPSDVFACWVPPWHDLGLLRFILGPVYCGAPCYLVPPAVRTLPLWLRTAAEERATILGAPDFAYRLATRLVDPRGLDLSALRYATNGGEPVRQSTITAFEERFGVPGVLRPGYGLAEATLGVTCLAPGEPLRVDARGNVSCGRPFPGVEVRIAPPGLDPLDGPDTCGTGAIGEILVRGPGVFAGYFEAEEESREALRGGWLHTGDVGAVDGDGHLYVLGRQRAMLKRGGAPLAPRDVEEAAARVTGVRAAAAVGLPPAANAASAASEEIAVALEAEAAWAEPFAPLAAAVAAAIDAALGFAPESILVLAPRSLPRTANGKVQHQALRRQLLDGTLERRGLVLFDSRRRVPEKSER